MIKPRPWPWIELFSSRGQESQRLFLGHQQHFSISNFLAEISFTLYFSLFLCIGHWGRLSYLSLLFFRTLHWNEYLFFFPFLFAYLLFTAICKASSDSVFLFVCFLHFFFLGMVLLPASCTMSWTSIHSSSGTLSIISSPLNLFLTSTV